MAQETVEWITPSEEGEGLYDLDWPGGTLEKFVRDADAVFEDIAVVPAAGMERLIIPQLELQALHPDEIMKLPDDVFSGTIVTDTKGRVLFEGDEPQEDRPVRYQYYINQSALDRFGGDQQERRFDIDFQGGSVKEYIDVVQKSMGEMKVVVEPGAGEKEAPPVALTNVTLKDAVELLDDVTDVIGYFENEVVVVVTKQPRPSGRSHGETVEEAPVEESFAWAVEGIIGAHMSSEDLLSAIDQAIELSRRRHTRAVPPGDGHGDGARAGG